MYISDNEVSVGLVWEGVEGDSARYKLVFFSETGNWTSGHSGLRWERGQGLLRQARNAIKKRDQARIWGPH